MSNNVSLVPIIPFLYRESLYEKIKINHLLKSTIERYVSDYKIHNQLYENTAKIMKINKYMKARQFQTWMEMR